MSIAWLYNCKVHPLQTAIRHRNVKKIYFPNRNLLGLSWAEKTRYGRGEADVYSDPVNTHRHGFPMAGALSPTNKFNNCWKLHAWGYIMFKQIVCATWLISDNYNENVGISGFLYVPTLDVISSLVPNYHRCSFQPETLALFFRHHQLKAKHLSTPT